MYVRVPTCSYLKCFTMLENILINFPTLAGVNEWFSMLKNFLYEIRYLLLVYKEILFTC